MNLTLTSDPLHILDQDRDIYLHDFKLKERPGIKEYEGALVVKGPDCHSPGITGYGSLDSKIMFIGISPASHEMRSGRPLTGPSGQVLDRVLSAINLNRKDVYVTNLICWWKNDPSKEEADHCYDRLLTEIKLVQPKLIVFLGTIVSEYFNDRKFGQLRGATFWDDRFNCYVMSAYHPAAILHNMGEQTANKDDKAATMIHDFVRDLKKLPDIVSWIPYAPQSKVDYEVIDNHVEAQRKLDFLYKKYNGTNEPIALDVETTYAKDDEEVDTFDTQVLCVGVGTSYFAWIFTPKALYKEDGTPALKWPDLHWTMHNSIFDVQIVRKYLGQWLEVKEDTMLQSYSLDERGGVHRLKTLAREYLACGFYEETRFKGKLKLDEIPSELLYEYNAKDVCYTARLCKKFRPEQEADNVRGFYDSLLIPSVNMYKEVQFRGAYIDKEFHTKLAIEWGEKYLYDEQELVDMAEQIGFQGRINLNSPMQLAKLLYEIIGLPILKKTKKGAPSTDQKTLEKLKGQHEFIDKFMDFRHLDHMYGLYIIGMMGQLKVDGRAHAIVKLHASVTGRPSYTKPPLQTIPRSSIEYAASYGLLRRLFIASPIEWIREFHSMYSLPMPPESETEYVIIEADYGKAELWTAANVSNDPQMFEDLKSGDYHTKVAASIKEKPIEEVTKDDRDVSKRVSFGVLYDMESKTLGELIKVSRSVAQGYIVAFHKRNKIYSEWFKRTQQSVRRSGELVTVTGRKRRIIVLGSAIRALKQAVNFPIQSVANDVLQDAALEIHPKIKALAGHILFTVHDSIISEVPKSKVSEAVQIIHDAMTAKRFEGMVQLPVEIKIGSNWGEAKEVHDCSAEASKQKSNSYDVPAFGRCLY